MNMDIGSVNTLKLVNCFHFQVTPLLALDFLSKDVGSPAKDHDRGLQSW